ncbi:MAG: hydroxyacylglutathione hydrolase [Pseudomonadota bacterium]|nr:hydroxyacylglutathione hydrolase [Pseudomonadota bacterium]
MAAIIPIPAFTDNYIWVIRNDRHAAIVDPGDAAPVIAYLDQHGLELAAIITTHHHNDHVGGNRALLARSAVPVYGPAREHIPGRTQALGEGDVIEVPEIGLSLSVLDVPGHTAGHIAYTGRDEAGPLAFVGDTLFACGCGRLFEGTAQQMYASLAKLAALDPASRIFCAHEYTVSNLRFARAAEPSNAAVGERMQREEARRARGEPTVPSLLSEELATNPFLRAGQPALMRSAAAKSGRELREPVDSFAVLRGWKDTF